MPETPDFDQIARHILDSIWATDVESERATDVKIIAVELRLVWNARGAADLAKLEALMFPVDDGRNLQPGAVISFELFERALRAMDH